MLEIKILKKEKGKKREKETRKTKHQKVKSRNNKKKRKHWEKEKNNQKAKNEREERERKNYNCKVITCMSTHLSPHTVPPAAFCTNLVSFHRAQWSMLVKICSQALLMEKTAASRWEGEKEMVSNNGVKHRQTAVFMFKKNNYPSFCWSEFALFTRLFFSCFVSWKPWCRWGSKILLIKTFTIKSLFKMYFKCFKEINKTRLGWDW